MVSKRKDPKGRALYKGESVRKNGYYIYQYYDMNHVRRTIYAKDIVELRKKERQLQHDLFEGIDTYAGEHLTLNMAFDKYIAEKRELKQSSRSCYKWLYDNQVRPTFGNRKMAKIKYSDVRAFYMYLLTDKKLNINTVSSINLIIHSVFRAAVRDDILKKNPVDGVFGEIKKSGKWVAKKRHALTYEQQSKFMSFVAMDPVYSRWQPLFTVLFGTGGRIGEILGLRWEDIDMENRTIHINHSVGYVIQDNGKVEMHISTPKTRTSIRTIPMFDEVYRAFDEEKEYQKEFNAKQVVIDGYTGFVFTNRNGGVYDKGSINNLIKRIYENCNSQEIEAARLEHRQPVIVPHFSCHNIRHTFCSRLCENEVNVKVIQNVMGHADIKTTLNIYAEVTEEKKKNTFQEIEKKMKIGKEMGNE